MFNDLFFLNLITRKDREAPIKIAYLKIEKHQLKLPPPSEVFCFENVFFMWTIVKVFIELVAIFCFMFWLFGHQGSNPHPLDRQESP